METILWITKTIPKTDKEYIISKRKETLGRARKVWNLLTAKYQGFSIQIQIDELESNLERMKLKTLLLTNW